MCEFYLHFLKIKKEKEEGTGGAQPFKIDRLVILRKLLDVSGPQFPHLFYGVGMKLKAIFQKIFSSYFMR